MKLGYRCFNKQLKKFRIKKNGKKYFVDGEWSASAILGLSDITEFPYRPYWAFNLYWFFTDKENMAYRNCNNHNYCTNRLKTDR